MSDTLQALVIGDDPSLVEEFELALGGSIATAVVLDHEADLRRGVEAVRNRQPDVVFLLMPRDRARLRAHAEEMQASAPDAVLIGVFDPADLGPDDGDFLIDALRARLRDFLRRPISSAELADVLGRHVRRFAPTTRDGRRGRVVSFVSNKGGVGKTTLATSAACLLARRAPDRVLLIDASLQLGQCASLLDLDDGGPTLADAVEDLDRLDGTLLRELTRRHDCGLHLLAAPLDAVAAADVSPDALSRIVGIARRTWDLVIVDTFPLVDALNLAILDRSDASFVVVANTVPTVLGAARLLDLLARVGVPVARQRVVLNDTHPRHAAGLSAADVAERLGRDVDHAIPFEKGLLVAANTGEPHALQVGRRFGFGRALHALAADVRGDGRPQPVVEGAIPEVGAPEDAGR